MSRHFTAFKDGVVVRNGSFSDEELLRLDFPESEYTLVLDELHYPDPPEPSYADQRRPAYPPLGDFADALYWQSKGDNSKLEAYFAKCELVKAQFPKDAG